jgi:hypothetical protein
MLRPYLESMTTTRAAQAALPASKGRYHIMTSTITRHPTFQQIDDDVECEGSVAAPSRTELDGRLYRFHGLCVLDLTGRPIGQIDWIWSSGQHGEFIGVQLQWLRGKARAIPAASIEVDPAAGAVTVPYTRAEINRAPRHKIDRDLTVAEKRAIRAHYDRRPRFVPSADAAAELAA